MVIGSHPSPRPLQRTACGPTPPLGPQDSYEPRPEPWSIGQAALFGGVTGAALAGLSASAPTSATLLRMAGMALATAGLFGGMAYAAGCRP